MIEWFNSLDIETKRWLVGGFFTAIGLLFLAGWTVFKYFYTIKIEKDKLVITAENDSKKTFTIHDYEKSLQNRENILRRDLDRAHIAEKQLLQREIDELRGKLNNIKTSYEERIVELKNASAQLSEFNDLPSDKLEAAQEAIRAGDTSLAEQLLADVEAEEQIAVSRAAKAAFQRGKIAEGNLDYKTAYEHFSRAAKLESENWEYQMMVGNCALQTGDYDEALRYYNAGLNLAYTQFGENDFKTASSLNNLAGLYQAQGAYASALPLFEKALAINKERLGESHRETTITLNNLGLIYIDQKCYEKALPLFKQALAINRKLLGDAHPEVAMNLSNLSLLYAKKMDYYQAIPLSKQALMIIKEALGEYHPMYAISLNNLAEIYRKKGLYDEARPLFEQALGIRREVLGENHPDTATSLNSIGLLFYDQEVYDNALLYFERAIDILTKILPESHPNIITTRESLQLTRDKLNEQ